MFGMKAAIRSPSATPAPERLLHAGDLVVELRAGHAPLHLVLAPEDDRVRGVAAAEQVLGEVEGAVGEETRAGHALAVHQHARSGLADHAAEFPQRRPEIREVRDRPGVQRRVIADVEAVALVHALHERRHVRVRDALGRGTPEGLVGHGVVPFGPNDS